MAGRDLERCAQAEREIPVKPCMMLTHGHFLAKRKKWFPKPLIIWKSGAPWLRKVWFYMWLGELGICLLHKLAVWDRKSSTLLPCYTPSLGEWGEWALNFNTLVTYNIGEWIKASFCSLWICIDIASLYLCISDAAPFLPVWIHHAHKWVRERTTNERKAVSSKKTLHKCGPGRFAPRRDWKNEVRYMIQPELGRRCGWQGSSRKAELRTGDTDP